MIKNDIEIKEEVKKELIDALPTLMIEIMKDISKGEIILDISNRTINIYNIKSIKY